MAGDSPIGAEIKRLRLQLGLTQDQLGERVHCSKQHISNIERGSVFPSIELTRRFDDVFEARNYLINVLRDARIPLVEDSAREGQMEVSAHLLYPVVSILARPSRPSFEQHRLRPDIAALHFDTLTVGQSVQVGIFPFGVAVVHETHKVFPASLTELAEWRRSQISRKKEAAAEHLRAVESDASVLSVEPYCLVLLCLEKAMPEHSQQLERVLQILSCPSILIEREYKHVMPPGSVPDLERRLLEQDTEVKGSVSFGFSSDHIGWASWSGVSVHFRKEKDVHLSDILQFEMRLQAVWTYADFIEHGGNPIGASYGAPFLRTVRRQLVTVGGTEHVTRRHMREALITTSRIIDKIDSALDVLAIGS